jgi:hypothetical protein
VALSSLPVVATASAVTPPSAKSARPAAIVVRMLRMIGFLREWGDRAALWGRPRQPPDKPW